MKSGKVSLVGVSARCSPHWPLVLDFNMALSWKYNNYKAQGLSNISFSLYCRAETKTFLAIN